MQANLSALPLGNVDDVEALMMMLMTDEGRHQHAASLAAAFASCSCSVCWAFQDAKECLEQPTLQAILMPIHCSLRSQDGTRSRCGRPFLPCLGMSVERLITGFDGSFWKVCSIEEWKVFLAHEN